MRAIMNIENLTSIESIGNFLDGSQAIAFSVPGDKSERYQLIQKILVKFDYIRCSRKDKGLLKSFISKVSGYSRAQITRLINQYKKTGKIQYKPCKTHGFKRKYSDSDIRLLAKMDEQHESPCGHTIKKLCERALVIYGEKEYNNLAGISVSHLYNLRASSHYQSQRRNFSKTKPRAIAIGERRKPRANGKPGYIRIDTVHQGDMDKQKGVYHINAVDEVTQFEVVMSTERISENYLLPILEKILNAFPFKIIGFHSDNGSEFINKQVARLLQKLLIDFTKSRARHSNDNALAESKNARIVRKQFGYSHIKQGWANRINEFNQNYLYPYINFHRPCFFPEVEIDSKGKEHKVYKYKNMMTPYDKLKSIPNSNKYFKTGITFEKLEQIAMKMTDNQAAKILIKERQKLFNEIYEQDRKKA